MTRNFASWTWFRYRCVIRELMQEEVPKTCCIEMQVWQNRDQCYSDALCGENVKRKNGENVKIVSWKQILIQNDNKLSLPENEAKKSYFNISGAYISNPTLR